eukprot:TRINITY_DN23435_c0_g1_i2.p3 TRINITY_DN23435_c0_g1~~TRINITY_DN23435_c0_g1_i2.p3  ORF type:complete len:137 (+),score=19.13 TRINITY_DN23435_c0_g1_i2:144-554(+)
MIVDADHVDDTAGQRDSRPDRPRAVAFEQHARLLGDHVVGALAADRLAAEVVERLRAVHADREAEAMRVEPVDDLRRQQRRVGRQAEVDDLADLVAPSFGVVDDLADERQIAERLAAEEHDVRAVPVRVLRQQHLC